MLSPRSPQRCRIQQVIPQLVVRFTNCPIGRRRVESASASWVPTDALRRDQLVAQDIDKVNMPGFAIQALDLKIDGAMTNVLAPCERQDIGPQCLRAASPLGAEHHLQIRSAASSVYKVEGLTQ